MDAYGAFSPQSGSSPSQSGRGREGGEYCSRELPLLRDCERAEIWTSPEVVRAGRGGYVPCSATFAEPGGE